MSGITFLSGFAVSMSSASILINTGNVGLQKFLWALSYLRRFYENSEIDAAKHGQYFDHG